MKLMLADGTLPMVANAPFFKTDRGPVRAVTVRGVHLIAAHKDGMPVTVSVEGVTSLQAAIQAAIKATERKLPILVSVEKVDSYNAAMRAAMGDDSADFDAVTACAVPDDSNAMSGQMLDDLVAALRIREGQYFCIVVENSSREGVRLPDMPRLLDKAYEQYDSDRETGSVGLAMDAARGKTTITVRIAQKYPGRFRDLPEDQRAVFNNGGVATHDYVDFWVGDGIACAEYGFETVILEFSVPNAADAISILNRKNPYRRYNFVQWLQKPVGTSFKFTL